MLHLMTSPYDQLISLDKSSRPTWTLVRVSTLQSHCHGISRTSIRKIRRGTTRRYLPSLFPSLSFVRTHEDVFRR